MEEVLDVYTRPHDPDRPLVCLDETSKQLVSETRTPVPMKPGQPERVDYEYERNGTGNLFMLFAPLEGFRHVEVTDHRKAVDYAKILKDLSDIHFPRAKKIVLVQDNLNTHAKASLYEAAKLLLGRPAAMKTKPKRIGASQPQTPASRSSASILGLNDSDH